jgi:hypothetical protein
MADRVRVILKCVRGCGGDDNGVEMAVEYDRETWNREKACCRKYAEKGRMDAMVVELRKA